ncbi:MAG: STAS domain-containing protein [Actinobacteria bacterium]|nr:STAS domain-containing protein [Actinomycetota bacterium]
MSPDDACRVSTAERDGRLVVCLTGELDVAVAGEVERAVNAAVAAAAAVVVDLDGLTFLDSAGVRVLDHLLGACYERGVPVRVVATPGSPAAFTLRVCAFPDHVMCASTDEALADLP